ncbi:hypothetical protein DL95DRAFT_473064 [Leptodontidium sp. 2 PMI_412]|nr:hypothetical protein DL95DRAFT_473064 [Leptodontidium sp. 2 PMI_412]
MMAWKDNALVLSLSTENDGQREVKCLRKRPSETSSLAKTSRVPFGPNATAWLAIPEYQYLYNHQMGTVDRGNQLKKPNSLELLCRLGGHQSLVTWLKDTAITNAYLLSFHSDVPREEKWTDQTAFRTAIIDMCFKIGAEGRLKRKSIEISLVEEITESERSLARMDY